MRYRLRTMLILLAIGPPIVAWYVWPRVREAYVSWQKSKVDARLSVIPSAGGWVSVIRGPDLRLIDVTARLGDLQAELARLEAKMKALRELEAASEGRYEMLREELDRSTAEYKVQQWAVARLERELPSLRSIRRVYSAPGPAFLNREDGDTPGALRFSPGIERAMLHEGTQRK